MTLRQRLLRSLLPLVVGTLLLVSVSGYFLVLSPALDSIAQARISQVAAIVAARIQRLTWITESQLQSVAGELADGTLSLDHQALNRRFMPVLARNPEFASLRIADPKGNEWLLYQDPQGGWINRLSNPDDLKGTHRFLHWRDSDTLKGSERRKSDYDPLQSTWYRSALITPRGEIAWSGVNGASSGKTPAITASMRLPKTTGGDLTVGLELLLDDIAQYLSRVRIGRAGVAVLLSEKGRILGLSSSRAEALPPRTELINQPAAEVELGPLQKGLELWREHSNQPGNYRLIWHDGEPWHVAYRRLELGKQSIWLGVHQPLSELLPGLYPQLLVLVAVLIITVGAVLGLAAAMARSVSRPLEQLIDDTLRIADLDFSPPGPVESPIQEIAQLAAAQEEMRNALAKAARWRQESQM